MQEHRYLPPGRPGWCPHQPATIRNAHKLLSVFQTFAIKEYYYYKLCIDARTQIPPSFGRKANMLRKIEMRLNYYSSSNTHVVFAGTENCME